MKQLSQNKQILAYLKSGKRITALNAFRKFNCLRLSGRIWDLRKEGYNITSQLIKTAGGKHVKSYWIQDEKT